MTGWDFGLKEETVDHDGEEKIKCSQFIQPPGVPIAEGLLNT